MSKARLKLAHAHTSYGHDQFSVLSLMPNNYPHLCNRSVRHQCNAMFTELDIFNGYYVWLIGLEFEIR